MHYNLTKKELEAIRHLRNFLMHNGRLPSVRILMNELNYKSPRSASIIIENLIDKGILERSEDGVLKLLVKDGFKDDVNNAETVNVPLLGNVACGIPILAEENVEAYVPVSVKLAKPINKYFLLRATGNSMNQAGISDGDLVLVKQQNTAENGDKVVALIDDEATIKEFYHNGETIVLKPKSNDKKHQPIILTKDFKIQGIVVTIVPI